VLSANGEWLAWQTSASNTLDATPAPCPMASTTVILRNLITGAAQRISAPPSPAGCGPAGSGASAPAIDWAGNQLVFTSNQPLVPTDTNGTDDAYAFDVDQRRLVRVSQTPAGGDANGPSTGVTISGDGLTVAYVSEATNLDTGEVDTNGVRDTHVGSLVGGAAARRLARTRLGEQSDGASQRPALNYGGTRLAFDSDAGNLAPGAQPGVLQVYQRANPLNGDSVFFTGFE
jgi:hypothetical protein